MSHLHNYLAVLSITALFYSSVAPAQEHDHAHEAEQETAAHTEEQAHGHENEHGHDEHGENCLVAAGEGEHFRCLLTPMAETLTDDVKVPVSAWKGLEKSAGDRVRISPL